MRVLRPTAMLALILLFAPTASGDERINSFEVKVPKNFGYVIGDEIVHEARIAVRAPLLLVPDTIPARLKVNDWLVVKQVEVREREQNGGRVYTLRIVYQIFHEPDQLEWLTIPERKLGFAGGGEAIEAVLPAWSFVIMPLVPEGADEFAGDRPTRFVPMFWPAARAIAFAAAFAALALAFVYQRWGRLLFGFRGPFARAEKDLRRLEKEGAAGPGVLRRVHRAFDETAGRAFFASMLPEFLTAHPEFRGKRRAILKFFEESERTFFTGEEGQTPVSPEHIFEIVRALKRAERRRGR